MTLSESDLKLFKKWLKGHLAIGEVTVTFTKKDGEERVMRCTTSPKLVPQEPLVEVHYTNTDNPVDFPVVKREKKKNDDVCSVYALDVNGWRSFRWDSVKSISITIGKVDEHSNEIQCHVPD
jgi:hypothetical protein